MTQIHTPPFLDFFPPAHLRDDGDRTASRRLMLIFGILSLGIILAGVFYYRNYERQFRSEVERQLSAIAELKVSELVQWRKERFADANILYRNAPFSALVQRFFEKPQDADALRQLRIWLGKFRFHYQYDRIFLLDASGGERMAVPDLPEPLASHLAQDALVCLDSGQVSFLGFHRDGSEGPAHLSLLVPILDVPGHSRPIGLLVFRIDPGIYLYPLISHWPTPSRTAETLLVQRDGSDVLFLNELRFHADTALKLRHSLENTDMPAVKAVLGQEGIVEGLDYRGEPVMAVLQPVPDSPWFLVARIDTAEVVAPLRERLWLTLMFTGVLLLASGAGLGLVWRHQRARFYRARYLVECERAWLQDVIARSLNLMQFGRGHSLEELLQKTLDEVGSLTDSPVGFYHFVEADQKTLSLQAWSTRTLREFCTAEGKGLHYGIGDAGVWADCVRLRRAVIHNDYAALPDRKGLPPGHAPVVRELVVPIFRQDRIVAILGVGNKPRDYTEKDIEVVTFMADVVWEAADRKQVEEELQQKERDLLQRNDELKRFTYTVSHDLKSPLVTIQAFLGYLEQDMRQMDTKRVDSDLGFIRNAAEKMEQLLSELHRFVRIGRSVNPSVESTLQSIVREALNLVAGQIAQRGVNIVIATVPVIVTGDFPSLVALFQNLVDNAVKFMEDQPSPRVEIGVAEQQGEQAFFVRDNGIGIDPRHRHKLFGLFEKLSAGSAGTGMGLAMVKRIVENHGGRIWAESEGTGKGSCFWFTLPGAGK